MSTTGYGLKIQKIIYGSIFINMSLFSSIMFASMSCTSYLFIDVFVGSIKIQIFYITFNYSLLVENKIAVYPFSFPLFSSVTAGLTLSFPVKARTLKSTSCKCSRSSCIIVFSKFSFFSFTNFRN